MRRRSVTDCHFRRRGGHGTCGAMTNPDGAGEARRRPTIRRIMLRDFRSYAALDLAIDGRLIVLCGENGAGKTNLLEALSLFSPGRGLRRAELAECARVGGAGGF